MMEQLMTKTQNYAKKNAPTILTCIGGVGVVATTVSAIRATPKAVQLLEAAKEIKGEELTKFEKFKMVTPLYIPTIIYGATTILCIFGANMLNKRHQASLVSAYALLDNSYKEYKKKVIEIHGEDGELEIVEAIVQDKFEEEKPEVKNDDILFYDKFSGRFFTSTMNDVLAAFYQINRHVNTNYNATLNDFYDYLEIPHIDGGDVLGWSVGMNSEAYWQEWIDFGIEDTDMDDGTKCKTITIYQEPMVDYDYY
jgi:hypothetical protein